MVSASRRSTKVGGGAHKLSAAAARRGRRTALVLIRGLLLILVWWRPDDWLHSQGVNTTSNACSRRGVSRVTTYSTFSQHP